MSGSGAVGEAGAVEEVTVEAAAAPAAARNVDCCDQLSPEDIQAQVREVLLTVVDSVPAADTARSEPPPHPSSPPAHAPPADDGVHSQPVDDDQHAISSGISEMLAEKDCDAEFACRSPVTCGRAEEEEPGVLKSPRARQGMQCVDIGVDVGEDHEQLVEEARLMLAMLDGHHLAYWQSRYDDELARVEMMSDAGGGAAIAALFTWYVRACSSCSRMCCFSLQAS